jgi:hypothetical protein
MVRTGDCLEHDGVGDQTGGDVDGLDDPASGSCRCVEGDEAAIA